MSVTPSQLRALLARQLPREMDDGRRREWRFVFALRARDTVVELPDGALSVGFVWEQYPATGTIINSVTDIEAIMLSPGARESPLNRVDTYLQGWLRALASVVREYGWFLYRDWTAPALVENPALTTVAEFEYEASRVLMTAAAEVSWD